MSFIFKYNYFH